MKKFTMVWNIYLSNLDKGPTKVCNLTFKILEDVTITEYNMCLF
jgi:hypothetical protein